MSGPHTTWTVHCETWAARYGSPYSIDEDDLPDLAVATTLQRGPSELGAHDPPTVHAKGEPIGA